MSSHNDSQNQYSKLDFQPTSAPQSQPSAQPLSEPGPSESTIATPIDSIGMRMWPPPSPAPTARTHATRPKTIHEGAFPMNFHFATSHPKAPWDFFNGQQPDPYPPRTVENPLSAFNFGFDNADTGMISK